MTARLQKTQLQISFGEATSRLDQWALNPWRKASLMLIALGASFALGNSIGAIAGAMALMDPVAALITVAFWELMVRTRRHWARDKQKHLGRDLLDMSRIGLLYGLLLEGFKLL